MVEDELRRAGVPADQALAESRRRMGNVTLAREDVREVWIVRWADRLRQHVRYGVRGLRREPVFALTAILTLALGSAATITVFSVVDAEIWRPLPYPNAHQLVSVRSRGADPKNPTDGISMAEFQEWRRAATMEAGSSDPAGPAGGRAFTALAADASVTRKTVQLAGAAESILTADVTANYFAVLGRNPIAGRVFAADDARGSRVAVLTERGWQRLFDRDPSVVGRSFVLDGRSVLIVGLVARDQALGGDPEMYLPVDESPSEGAASSSASASARPLVTFVGRLAPGGSLEMARSQLQSALDLRAQTDPSRRGHRIETHDLSTRYRRSDARPLFFFLGAAVIVLLLTVANIAGLLVSRAIRRTSEYALRGALGGGTGALVAQTMVEGALVALPGCAGGLLLAYLAVGALGQYVPPDFLWRGTDVTLDPRAIAFTFGVASVTALILSLIPLGIVRKAGARDALVSSQRTGESPRTARLRRALLVGQLALTVVLLAAGGIFLKSFIALQSVPLGFEPANAWSLRVTLSGPSFKDPAAIRAYVDNALDRLRAVPGVRYAAPATSSPLNSGWLVNVADVRSVGRLVGPDYFPAVGTSIIRGRGITTDDRAGAPLSAVVNEELVRRVFPGEDPIGKTVAFGGRRSPAGEGTATIVGVAANIKDNGMNEVTMPGVYFAFAQNPYYVVELIVRAESEQAALPATLRAAIADPLVPVTAVTSFSSRVDRALQPDRFNTIVVSLFAALATLMSVIGIYGAMAYAASARRREFGVRLALGATPGALVRAMLWHSTRLSLIAAALGLGGALLLAKSIGNALYLVPGEHNGLVYSVTTTDPAALAVAIVGIVVLAIVAGVVPARRAGKVDPVTELRGE